ncbi:hypothetical protein ACLB1R_29565 [Escherichia coli]
MMRLTCIGILAQFALLLLAFGVLTYCFLISDFSVIYVAQHSYSLLSWELKLAAMWGGHAGFAVVWGAAAFRLERAVCLAISAANRSAISADVSRFLDLSCSPHCYCL